MNAISLNSISFNIARIIGPLSAAGDDLRGRRLVLRGERRSASWSCSRRRDRARHAAAKSGRTGHARQALRAGSTTHAGIPLIRALLLLCITMSLFGFPYIVLMPAFAHDVLHLEARTASPCSSRRSASARSWAA